MADAPRVRFSPAPTGSLHVGGAGTTRDFPVERMMRDVKITQIYEGTNQIQRVVIARRVLDELA